MNTFVVCSSAGVSDGGDLCSVCVSLPAGGGDHHDDATATSTHSDFLSLLHEPRAVSMFLAVHQGPAVSHVQ